MSESLTTTWDLSDLFSGLDDPRIEQTLNAQKTRAQAFAAKYRGNIDSPSLTAETLRDAIAEYESIVQERDKPAVYASLLFSTDTGNPEYGAFLQKVRERSTDISLDLMFFDLELMALDSARIDPLLASPAMAHHAHYVQALRLHRDHVLSEPEEKILEEKSNTAERAFVRLFDEVVGDIPFKMTVDGKTETLTEPEIIRKLREPDREVRKAASKGLTEGMLSQKRVLTFVFNTLLQNKAVEDRLRGYPEPCDYRHKANELDKETVDLVIETTRRNYPLVARYYNVKREILGYDTLTHYDRYAPLFETKAKATFEEARKMVLDAFGAFSPTMAGIADEFFTKGWIDSAPRKGKRGGAYCSYATPDIHPYVFLSYMEQLEDVMTLAHELGHGVHAYVSRPLGYLNMHGPLPIAELASTFGEMLVFEKLQAEADLQDKLALYANKIEGIFATVFRQAAMHQFETELHDLRRSEGELTAERIGEIWQRTQQETFGDSVKLGDEHANWWMYISHFVHVPFYVYAYTFGELLVLGLFAQAQKEGPSFEEKYMNLLKSGGSLPPGELIGRVGIDLKDPAFWQGGFDILSGIIARFEGYYSEYKNRA
ncbi:MAG: M3 family oligoendopeptidase [Armatimonadetes bacterium]|nr:M3 family oligoendopeptidase [Armatimonadota bacterium]